MQISRMMRHLVLAMMVLAIPASSFAGVFISVGIAPPVLPVYVQPACPGDGYIWTPGYWAYGPDGYYWVPGTWVVAPEPGFLWTPGYWGFGGGLYAWHAGYWGPHIGFYGGVNYGFGYFGSGYEGGYWNGGHFFYNRTVNNINITNVHVYNKTVINNVTVNRVSYNGGEGGIRAHPGHAEEIAEHERHFERTDMQMHHENAARGNRELLASVNHGRPAIAATARPGEFRGHDVVPARSGGESYRPSENRPRENRMAQRPENSGRNLPRPQTSHQEAYNNNRPSQPMQNDARPESRGRMDSGPHSNAPRPEAGRPQHENAPSRQSAPSHENAPRGGRESHPDNGGEHERKGH